MYPSVRIRCQDIATHLGCDQLYSVTNADDVPARYSTFICVKAKLNQGEICKLAARGRVIWDILDSPPPKIGIAVYLASTQTIRATFSDYGRIEIIPHHHCNFENVLNPPDLRRPGWVGTLAWHPRLAGVDHDTYDVRHMKRLDVVNVYKRIGIGLNVRCETSEAITHTKFTSGIKLINCLGFGIPSISSREPAYFEVDPNCTIFADLADIRYWVDRLQVDDDLYSELRRKCVLESMKYHIATIAKQYLTLLISL